MRRAITTAPAQAALNHAPVEGQKAPPTPAIHAKKAPGGETNIFEIGNRPCHKRPEIIR